jgi:predicted enzyme related to lactoylglutathione lyase
MANPVLWFEVTGKDPKALREFYSELLGWRISAGDPPSRSDCGLIEPGYGGLPGGIYSSSDGSSGQATFYVEVYDPSAMLARAESLGGKTVMQETAVPCINLRFAYFADPEGHVIGLSKNAAVGGRGDAGRNPVLSFEVMGRDAKALREFYAELFGWKMKEAAAFGYWLVETGGDGVLGGIGPARVAGQDGGSGFATFKVEVEDPNAVLTKAAKLGGKIAMPVTEVPGTNLKIAYFVDPEGHVIGLTSGMGYRWWMRS